MILYHYFARNILIFEFLFFQIYVKIKHYTPFAPFTELLIKLDLKRNANVSKQKLHIKLKTEFKLKKLSCTTFNKNVFCENCTSRMRTVFGFDKPINNINEQPCLPLYIYCHINLLNCKLKQH